MAILRFKYTTTSTPLDGLAVLQSSTLPVGAILTSWDHFNVKICAQEISLSTKLLS